MPTSDLPSEDEEEEEEEAARISKPGQSLFGMQFFETCYEHKACALMFQYDPGPCQDREFGPSVSCN